MYVPFAILSTENLQHNINIINGIARKSKVMVMLKANGYGHGIRSTALRLDGLVDYMGVARIDEAIALRKVGIKAVICIMQGVFEQEDVITAACNNFELMIHSEAQLHYLNVQTPKKVNVWLKIDTGIGRLGFQTNEATNVFQKLRELPSVGTITLTSHFACADDKNHPLNTIQMKRFAELAKDFPGPKSLANSAAIFNFPESHYDIVRPGIAIYGVSPFNTISAAELGLKPVMTLMAKIMSVRDISVGSTIGYGARFTAESRMQIATVAIGYGDGYPRTISNGAPVLVKNNLCEIVGRLSMDMMTIDVSNCSNVQSGDLVTLWGNHLPIEKIASFTQNIPYDILTAVQLRVKFKWTL